MVGASRTGYVRGGCSPLGMRRRLPTYINETPLFFDHIAVPTSVQGGRIIVGAQDLARMAGATFTDLARM